MNNHIFKQIISIFILLDIENSNVFSSPDPGILLGLYEDACILLENNSVTLPSWRYHQGKF